MKPKILIIDDEIHIVELIKFNLETSGYEVDIAYDGLDGYLKIKENMPHLVLLDWMLPNISGIEMLKKIRNDQSLSDVPIIMLTAKNMESDKIEGLDLGADDYVTKPFSPLELIARVNSNIRRYTKFGALKENLNDKTYKTGDLFLDDETKKVIADGKEIKLTATEFKILKFLIKNKGKVFSIPQIYENVWNEEGYAAENIIAVHIRHIREKIEIDPKEPKYLKVIWGIGYKIEDIK